MGIGIPPSIIQEVNRVTIIGLVINLVLTTFKFVAGVIGQSQAVVAGRGGSPRPDP